MLSIVLCVMVVLVLSDALTVKGRRVRSRR